MQFSVFDHDALVTAMQHVWDQIAPPAMFTASGNKSLRSSEDFSTVLNNIKWDLKTSKSAQEEYAANSKSGNSYGFSGTSAIKPRKEEGSNGAPSQFDSEYNYFVEKWGKGEDIYVPAGFSPIRGENIVYADTLPPSYRYEKVA